MGRPVGPLLDSTPVQDPEGEALLPAPTRAVAKARGTARRVRRIPHRIRRESRKLLDRRASATPKLSVVVPVYNVREWIAPALESVLS